ncbi:MAG: response regulator transcription factor [Micrococcales bacterium]
MTKILVVDDEVGIREMLHDALSLAGFQVILSADGFDAVKLLRETSVDLIIADINMPKLDGYQMLERLRENGVNTPALLLTARHDRADVAKGFRVGADDYVTKPFSLEELVLRVNAILRRTSGFQGQTSLKVGPLELIDESHQVLLDSNPVELSPTEYRLLKYLMERPEKVVRKEILLDAIWGMGFATGATVVDTYISYLRKKLHTDTWAGIKTVRGVGFQITDKASGQ